MTVLNKENSKRTALGANALAQLFNEARTHNAFLSKPVPEALLREALELAKMGPTAANTQPMRLVFLRSEAAKERLRPAMSAGNVDKTIAAPVVAIAGHDLKFYDKLPKLFPHVDARSWFVGNDAFSNRTASQSGTLQIGYFILALRALGLDTGPMAGFDNAKVDAEFFPGGDVKSDVIINIGYGDDDKLFPRNPRLSFEEMATIL